MTKKGTQIYRKGMLLFHKDTKEKIIFGKWNEDIAACFTESRNFLNVPRKELEENYVSYAALENKAKEKRRGQTW